MAAGVAAQYLQLYPNATVDQVRDALTRQLAIPNAVTGTGTAGPSSLIYTDLVIDNNDATGSQLSSGDKVAIFAVAPLGECSVYSSDHYELSCFAALTGRINANLCGPKKSTPFLGAGHEFNLMFACHPFAVVLGVAVAGVILWRKKRRVKTASANPGLSEGSGASLLCIPAS